MKNYYKTLSIAGSDSGGGAGIQADLKTFSALDCYGMTVITALTAQNTLGVQGVLAVPPDFISLQLQSIFNDMSADAIKTGMLHSAEVIEVIANELVKHRAIPLVVDPVMVAKDGSLLLKESAIDSLKSHLFPLATLITPNLMEAETLLNYTITDKKLMEQAAHDLSQWGSKAVLLKGGHWQMHEGEDCLYLAEEQSWHWLNKISIKTQNTHGTGCTLSSAITAYLARGFNLLEAVRLAKDYIHEAIKVGSTYHLGKGCGPVQHFWDCGRLG